MRAPVAKKVPCGATRHGRRVNDDYAWLRERDAPAVRAYLESENAYADAALQHTEPLRQRLYREILGRIRETDRSVPEKHGPFLYYTRTVEGRPYAMHCRTPLGSETEQILLDENELAEGQPYFSLGALEVSPDHGLAAYAYDDTGDEKYVVRVLDLGSGQLLPDEIREADDSLAWAEDGRTLFYSTLDAAQRPHRLHRHVLGSDPVTDSLVYEEPDESFFLALYKTKDRRFLLLYVESNTTSEVRFLDARRPEDTFRIIHPREHRVEYSVEHHGDRFLILTNDAAVNFRLVQTPVADPGKANWTELLPHRPQFKLDAIDVFRNHLAVLERERGIRGVRLIDRKSVV